MFSGPQPKPTALRLTDGGAGSVKLNDAEPVPQMVKPKPPSHLSPEAVKVWFELDDILHGMGLLTEADVLAYTQLCELEALRRECYQKIKDVGSTFPVRAKTPVEKRMPDGSMQLEYPVTYIAEFPHVAHYRRYCELLIKLMDRFGLNPASRSRIRVDRDNDLAPEEVMRARLLAEHERLKKPGAGSA